MLWSERLPRLTGIILLLLCAMIIVNTAANISAGNDSDVFAKDEIDNVLVDIHDSKTAYGVGLASSVIVDAALGLIAGALLFSLLQDRSRALALVGLVGVVSATAVFMVSDGAGAVMYYLANDFASGGPGKLAAGDSSILEVARAVGMFQTVAGQAGFTALSVGLGTYSIIIGWSPAGIVTPPRWLGYVGVIASLAAFVSWLIIAADGFFVLFILTTLTQLIMLIGLGIWLISRPEESLAKMRSAT